MRCLAIWFAFVPSSGKICTRNPRSSFNNWGARVVCQAYEECASRNSTGAWVEARSGPGSPIRLHFGTQFWSIPGSTNRAETGSTISLFPVPAFGQMRFPLFPKVGTHCSAISGSTFSLRIFVLLEFVADSDRAKRVRDRSGGKT